MDSAAALTCTGGMPIIPATADSGSPSVNLPGGEPQMESPAGALVVAHGEWNGWRRAVVRVADLEDVHWWQPSGAPRPLLHAHVRCDKVVSGAIPHDCGDAPHDLFVCILKCGTAPEIYAALSRRAGAACLDTAPIR
jgi:hypothetical protein